MVIQKLWRGYTTRNPIFPRSRMSSMSDDVTFTSPVQSHAPGGRLMTRTTSGRFAWSEADGNPILGTCVFVCVFFKNRVCLSSISLYVS